MAPAEPFSLVRWRLPRGEFAPERAKQGARMEGRGKISRWNDDKGFGFIRPDAGGLTVFLALCMLPALGSIGVLIKAHLPWPLLAYVVASLLTYFLYWQDKRSALRGAWRTPEAQLHLFELLGGWPGALIAQQVFRHKTRKVSFQVVFWIIVLVHQVFWFMPVLGLLSPAR
ncbi:DUF1294 domain-containing protein [Archangium sp.]|uniref:DUF1294 domain-containing protein n=1 Tax=Archangium sp. TaxID=1872627 RepID=UPI00389A4FA6